MTMVPLDGEVKAFVNGIQIQAITKSGGQNFFDPGLVGSAYFGQTITFTVNDEPVETQMVIMQNQLLLLHQVKLCMARMQMLLRQLLLLT